MKREQIYMRYHKDYGCWLKNEGDFGKAMNPGDLFGLYLGENVCVPTRLGLAGQRLWYVEIGHYQVKLNLRINEIYKIEI